ncbi:hypothetical protein [Thalassospira lucentensis]|uniref:hypothetical protein n=1 Tax=Thalassospira lucentensis TaxID=168935 RepID=UPI002943A91D|nr:hypothetical protein [Thalassospira lucentensis]
MSCIGRQVRHEEIMTVQFNLDDTTLAERTLCYLLNRLEDFNRKSGTEPPIPGGDLSPLQVSLAFVRFKDLLDDTLKRPYPGKTVPGDYLNFMLPGMVFQSEKAEDRVCDIDPDLIIGASWQGYGAPPDPETEMDSLNSSTSRHPGKSTCRLLKNTSIHIAGEGKNRIELFRYHKRKVTTRISTVIPIKHPVIRRDLSGHYWIASWRQDNGIETFVTIPFPDITLPVYRLLGVKIDGKRMPVPLDVVRKSLASTIDEIAGRICQA